MRGKFSQEESLTKLFYGHEECSLTKPWKNFRQKAGKFIFFAQNPKMIKKKFQKKYL